MSAIFLPSPFFLTISVSKAQSKVLFSICFVALRNKLVNSDCKFSKWRTEHGHGTLTCQSCLVSAPSSHSWKSVHSLQTTHLRVSDSTVASLSVWEMAKAGMIRTPQHGADYLCLWSGVWPLPLFKLLHSQQLGIGAKNKNGILKTKRAKL